MALAPMMKWSLHQMNVNTIFLNSIIKEEVYIEQPKGFEVEDRSEPPRDIWLSSICSHTKIKEIQVEPFQKERNICWIL